MSYRVILFFVLAVAIISTAQLSTTVLSSSPYSASTDTLWSFYISAFISLSCILGLILYGIRVRTNRLPQVRALLISIRQSALLSLVILLSLFFNTLRILQLWNIVPLILAAILIEFFFQAEKRPQAHLEYEK